MYVKNRNRLMDIKNKVMVEKKEREQERDKLGV